MAGGGKGAKDCLDRAAAFLDGAFEGILGHSPLRAGSQSSGRRNSLNCASSLRRLAPMSHSVAFRRMEHVLRYSVVKAHQPNNTLTDFPRLSTEKSENLPVGRPRVAE